MMNIKFRDFLLNENKHYLGQKSGDVLTSLQNLEDDVGGMGNRASLRACQGIANQIRRILHGSWEEEDVKYLKRLQKVGVALMKAIDEKEDMEEVISSCGAEMQKLIDDLEVPINSLASSEDTEDNSKEPEPLMPGSEFGA
jgi:hypothetical protein